MKDFSTKEWGDFICEAVQSAAPQAKERHHKAVMEEDWYMAGLYLCSMLKNHMIDEHETSYTERTG